ncbi:hypothetical protein VTH06DRAFT_3217 [Thermothelomyces fergusii]
MPIPEGIRFPRPGWAPRWRRPGYLRAIPTPALQLIGLLVFVNGLVWVAAGIVLHYNPKLISPAVLSYTLGLRHALDADHISAIDLMTRRLIASGQRPVAVGTFFSLGHSTVVVVTCVAVAATAGALRDRFADFQRVGAIIGTSVSAAFLLLLCAGNGWVLWRLVRRLRAVLDQQQQQQRRWRRRGALGVGGSGLEEGEEEEEEEEGGERHAAAADLAADAGAGTRQQPPQLEGPGFLANVFRNVFRMVDRPWKMLPLGILFGLGFDTSSEIAILGIASIQAAQGTSIWVILIFPALFTAGMFFSRDAVAILYYSIVLTGITVFVAAFIGIIQVLSLVENVAEPEGSFWDGVGAIGDHYDIIGGCICGLFLLVGLGSVLIYRPWRRRMDRRARHRAEAADGETPDTPSSEPRSPDLLLPGDGPRALGYGGVVVGTSGDTTKKLDTTATSPA